MSETSPTKVEESLAILRGMWTARAFEEKASELFSRGRIAGLLHLGIGQEAVAVGACSTLRRDDQVFGGHRAHALAVAKGADPQALFAELAGRVTGCCRGKGGSMHLSAMEAGFVTATGVVGGNVPLALGGALACRERGERQVAAVFFGDGAAQTGAFHESLNIASLWKLPLVFVCENNGYAEFTPLSAHTLVAKLADYAKTYAIPSVTVDGNDVLAVRPGIAEAVERARAGGGPSFVECITYRLRGHYEGDPSKYRERAEVAEWKAMDPVARFAAALLGKGICTEDALQAVEREERERIGRAADAALSAAWPGPEELASQVFAES